MIKVEPYEHKGTRIRAREINSILDALEMYQWYLLETNVWLKKLCAKRLLEYENLIDLAIDKEDLLRSMQCQIDL